MVIAFKINQVLQIVSSVYWYIANAMIGNESIAVVEFAPFQKIPPERKKVDPRAGTIEGGWSCLIYLSNQSIYA